MLKHNQNGSAILPIVLLSLLLVAAIGFGAWAFTGRQDYKDNVDTKIATAVDTAKTKQSTFDNQQFTEANKSPVQTYNGPETYGSLQLSFPKSWSAYIDDTSNGDSPINAYFYPKIIPALTDSNSVFALRVKVLNRPYSEVIQNFNNQKDITVSAYALPKVPKVVGIRVKGSTSLDSGVRVVDMVVLRVRSDTLEVWTEGTKFGPDFEKYVLPNISFSP